jgi:hypothetical protein
MHEFHSRWLDWSPKAETSDEAAFVSFGSGSPEHLRKTQLPEPVEGPFVSFGSGSSKRSLKAQPPEEKESQSENLGRALPKLTKAPSKPVAQAPFDEFMAEWRATAKQVHVEFTRNSVQPSEETFQAAVWFQIQFNEPWITILGRISKAAAKRFFDEIVRGRCIAGFDDYGRVVIRNALRARTKAID